MARENMARDAMKLVAGYEHTVIDGPPLEQEVTRSCIIAADFVVLPIEPSGLSTWASELTVRQVREAQEYKSAPSTTCLSPPHFVPPSLRRKDFNHLHGRDPRVRLME